MFTFLQFYQVSETPKPQVNSLNAYPVVIAEPDSPVVSVPESTVRYPPNYAVVPSREYPVMFPNCKNIKDSGVYGSETNDFDWEKRSRTFTHVTHASATREETPQQVYFSIEVLTGGL